MKKNPMSILSVISLFFIVGCQVQTSPDTVSTTEPKATEAVANVQGVETDELFISKDKVQEFVREHKEEYNDVFDDPKEEEIVIEKREQNGREMYYFLYTPANGWCTTLFQIQQENGEILSLDYVSEGATDYFDFDVISITEGEFVTAYSATHMGNGSLVLVGMDTIADRQVGDAPDYELYAIDGYYEDMELGDKPKASKVFANNALLPEYRDVNGDGNTDIVLTGKIENYIYDEVNKVHTLTSTDDVCQMYVFNPETMDFELEQGEDLTDKIQLSIGDILINNHELLNEMPCMECRVQDIKQYQGEPKKSIDYMDENGLYHHYMIYDGIIYVVLGEANVEPERTIDHVILTNELYSLAMGIQVGMEEDEITETGIYFDLIKNGDDLDSQLLSGISGYLRKMKIAYDTIYYAESCFEENVAVAVIVKDGKITRIATDKLYS